MSKSSIGFLITSFTKWVFFITFSFNQSKTLNPQENTVSSVLFCIKVTTTIIQTLLTITVVKESS